MKKAIMKHNLHTSSLILRALCCIAVLQPIIGKPDVLNPPPSPANVRIQSLLPEERTATLLPPGHLVYDESDPATLYIGDGVTPGGLPVSPPTPPWNHSASQDIRLNGHRLHLGNGYSLLSLGGYHAISGSGELQSTPGSSAWSVNSVPLIRLLGAELLINIDSFTWHPNAGDNGQFQLLVNVGDNTDLPTVQTTDNLLTAIWTDLVPASIGEIIDGQRLIVIDLEPGTTLQFFRVRLPFGTAQIELLAHTTITGNLTVTGSVQAAGQVTTHEYTLGFFPQPAPDDLDWLLISDETTISASTPGFAYARIPASQNTAFTLQHNGTAIGTVDFPQASQTGTITLPESLNLQPGDRLELKAGAQPDPLLADIQITLAGALAPLATLPPMPYRLGFYPQPAPNETDWLLVSTALLIPQTDPGLAYARIPASQNTAFTLQHNGTAIGTVDFPQASQTGTLTLNTNLHLSPGDRLELKAGPTPDTQLSDIQIVLKGLPR